MLNTCPKCRQTYVGKTCPRCAPVRPGAQRLAVTWDNPLASGHWSQNPWIRCGVGIAVAQGLFLGVRRWAEAGVSLFGPADMDLTWTGYSGLAAWTLLQFLCVLAGSMLVGAGQRDWLFYGLAVGFINMVIDLAICGERIRDVDSYFVLLMMATTFCAGVLGSRLGAAIWKPIELHRPALEFGGAKQGGIAVKDFFAGMNFITLKVNWLRILLGSAIGISGPPLAEWLFYRSLGWVGLRGAVEHSHDIQRGVFIIMIKILSVFLAGLVAGMNTSAGAAHGFWAGVLSAIGMVFVKAALAQQSIAEPINPEEIVAYAFITVGLCTVGGFFGSRLLPPVLHTGKRKLTKVAEI
jgi:hypothetical protein